MVRVLRNEGQAITIRAYCLHAIRPREIDGGRGSLARQLVGVKEDDLRYAVTWDQPCLQPNFDFQPCSVHFEYAAAQKIAVLGTDQLRWGRIFL